MEIIDQRPLSAYAFLVLGSLVLLLVFKAVYDIFFHPLRKFPGPWINKISIVCTIFTVLYDRITDAGRFPICGRCSKGNNPTNFLGFTVNTVSALSSLAP